MLVAGARYANRWHRHARRFVRRNTDALRVTPVWLVSSGPLDDSAEHGDIAPTKQVRKLAEPVGARGHVTFGGRLTSDAKGLAVLTQPRARVQMARQQICSASASASVSGRLVSIG